MESLIDPYGINNLVHISGNAKGFIKSIETELQKSDRREWIAEVDRHLKNLPWDRTCFEMLKQINRTIKNINTISVAS